MKKYLLHLLFAVAIISLGACAAAKKWSDKERAQMQAAIDNYRKMVYLDDLSNLEFDLFSEALISNAELLYPSYTVMVELPSSSDTLDVWVVNGIAEQLAEDADNMRHLYPYHKLVKEGILPEGLDHASRKAFYNCLAGKIKRRYPNMLFFVNALLNEKGTAEQIKLKQQKCAADLFDWEVVVESVTVSE
ncbi:MAG: hypothetical protein SNH88_02745 [Rikenellaceae bacterium]